MFNSKSIMRYYSIVLILLCCYCCQSGNDRLHNIKKAFQGFEKVISNVDSIPETLPGENNISVITVPDDITSKILDFSFIVDSTYYTKLSTSPASLIGDIDKILFIEERIIIVEWQRRQSVLLFNRNGTFITKIGIQGNGPGEYLNIRDVAIDKTNAQIVLLDDFGRKLLFYDLDGKLLSFKRLFYYPVGFFIFDNGAFLFYQARDVNIHIPSSCNFSLLFALPDQEIISKSLPYNYLEKYPMNKMGSLHSFNVCNKVALYNPIFTNLIYEIKEFNRIEARYSINIGSKDIVKAFNIGTTTNDIPKLLNTGKFYFFEGESVSTENFLYFRVKLGGDCFYSKNTGNLYCGNAFRLSLDRADIISFYSPITSDGDFFVSVIWPYKLLKNPPRKQLNNELKLLIDSLKEEDNPILFFYSLKSI